MPSPTSNPVWWGWARDGKKPGSVNRYYTIYSATNHYADSQSIKEWYNKKSTRATGFWHLRLNSDEGNHKTSQRLFPSFSPFEEFVVTVNSDSTASWCAMVMNRSDRNATKLIFKNSIYRFYCSIEVLFLRMITYHPTTNDVFRPISVFPRLFDWCDLFLLACPSSFFSKVGRSACKVLTSPYF